MENYGRWIEFSGFGKAYYCHSCTDHTILNTETQKMCFQNSSSTLGEK